MVIDSDGEHEEVEECNLSKKVNTEERPEPHLLEKEITGASHRKQTTQSGEATAADGSTENCQPLQLEKSILGNVDSPATQVPYSTLENRPPDLKKMMLSTFLDKSQS